MSKARLWRGQAGERTATFLRRSTERAARMIGQGRIGRVGESVRTLRRMRIPKGAFLDMQDVTYPALKGIQLREAVESWGSSKEPHGLRASWATRRRGRGSGGAFVAHEPNSICRATANAVAQSLMSSADHPRRRAHQRAKVDLGESRSRRIG